MIDKHDHSMHAPAHVTVASAPDVARVMAVVMSLRVECRVVSPPGAGCFMGVEWWQAVVADCKLPALLDCGLAAGFAGTGLRAGLDGVIVQAPPAQQRALHALARVTGGQVLDVRPATFDLPPDGAGEALARYLRAHRAP
ncbi:hypothetical protein [Komagataeibacter medellinensis]|nr:hypothetical protein [Komagataeibacter medellinensis]